MFILEPYNTVYFIFIGTVFALMGILIWRLGKKDMETRERVILIVASATAVLLLFYKFTYFLDAEFIRDYPKYWGEYTIFNELPINPCNLVILFLPFAIWKKNDYLMSYSIFMGTVGMSLAILAPQQGYAGYNFYQYHYFFQFYIQFGFFVFCHSVQCRCFCFFFFSAFILSSSVEELSIFGKTVFKGVFICLK